ncbi:MAG: 2-oxoacid:acceptor oxidoreductase family protein [Armatimonadota bacterium]
MHQEVIMAGTGGQGIMVIGQLLAYGAVGEDKNVVWFPSYGPETRGGTADCTVIVSDGQIGSPVTAVPDTLLAMSQIQIGRHASKIKKDGFIFFNSTLVEDPSKECPDCKSVGVPASEIADELGNMRVANMVMLGAFVEVTKSINLDSVCKALTKVLPSHRQDLIPLNEAALRKGAEYAAKLK